MTYPFDAFKSYIYQALTNSIFLYQKATILTFLYVVFGITPMTLYEAR